MGSVQPPLPVRGGLPDLPGVLLVEDLLGDLGVLILDGLLERFDLGRVGRDVLVLADLRCDRKEGVPFDPALLPVEDL